MNVDNADLPSSKGWRQPNVAPSLPEVHRTIPVKSTSSILRKLLTFTGPGYLIAVGYMDPGNWATDIGGGSKFGYTLLSIILMSSIAAMFLQALAIKLGIVTGRDLAQACRDHYSERVTFLFWIMSEIAIIACDLAEVLGSAVALKLLFGLPLLAGVCLTTIDIFLLLYIQSYGFRLIEACVMILMLTIMLCFAYEIFISKPLWLEAAHGFIPDTKIFTNRELLYGAIGIIGATIMPHNLYLHSSIVQTRAFDHSYLKRKEALRFAIIDSTVALFFAFLINSAILILGAAVFHHHGLTEIADIGDAYKLLTPMLGVGIASTVFACALLAAGQNSALTCTLAGQIVMEGFLKLRLSPWVIRLITRGIALIPAILVILIAGENQVTALLILSQVILSFQLPFAIIPLILFTNAKNKMGQFANSRFTSVIAWIIALIIIVFNAELIYLSFHF